MTTGETVDRLAVARVEGGFNQATSTMRPILEIVGISKRFRSAPVLNDLSLSVRQASIFGLLGPNGAGKTTLLRIIAGLVQPDRGQVRLWDAPACPQTRRRFGMLIEAPALYPFLTARDHLEALSGLHPQPHEIDPLLRKVGLHAAADRPVGGFSLGMKQRLGLAAALIGRPDGLILDEPTNGLDPDGILDMRLLIQDLARREGITVILSSHQLDEVERLCDRVAILNQGRLVDQGAVKDLLNSQNRFFLRADPMDRLLSVLGGRAEVFEDGVTLAIAPANVPELLRSLVLGGFELREAKWITPDLQSVFLDRTRVVQS